MDYILTVPVNNEEKALPLLMKSIVNQTVLPKLCVIVDDGSTDNTPEIINKLERDFTWICHKRLARHVRDKWKFSPKGSPRFAKVVNEGFEYAREICNKNDINYEYLGKVDADVILPEDYFEKLMEQFQQDPQLGIASGGVYKVRVEGSIIDASKAAGHKRGLPDCPTDGARLYRKACFNDIGGFPLIRYSPDSVALAKARLRGWRTRRFKEIKIFLNRAEWGGNFWEGYKFDGYLSYCLNHHPLLSLFRVWSALKQRPHWGVFAWLYGYFLGFLHREEKIADPELRYYYRHQRLREITKIVVRKLRAPFRWRQEGKL